MEYRYTNESMSSIDEYGLRCSTCNLVCTNPVNCPEGHDHCRDCVISSNCSKCHAEGCEAAIDLSRLHTNYVAKKMIDSLKIYCPNREQETNRDSDGSDGSGGKRKRNIKLKFTAPSMVTPSKSKNLDASMTTSPRSILHDPGCLWEGPRKALADHLSDCPYEKVSCAFIGCHMKIPRKKLLEHEETCEYGHTTCPKCGEDLINIRETLELHPNECKQEVVECSNRFCYFMCVREEFRAHVENENFHIELLTERLIESNRLIASSKIDHVSLNPQEVVVCLKACIDCSDHDANLNLVLHQVSDLCGNHASKVALGELGCCEVVVSLLKRQLISDHPSVELIEGSCCAISSLCCHENRSTLQSVGACDIVAKALDLYESNENVVAIGCNAVGNLSHLDNSIKTQFGDLNGCESVVGALHKYVDDSEDIVAQACGAISNLSSSESNRLKFIELDIVDLLEHAKDVYPNHSDIVKWCSKCILRFTDVN